MRSDLEAYKFDKDKWSTELSPILNLWKKLNQVSQLVLASFCFVFVFSFVCFLFSMFYCVLRVVGLLPVPLAAN